MDKKEFNKIIDRYINGQASEEDLSTLQQFEAFAEANFAPLDLKEAKEKTYLQIEKQINTNRKRVYKSVLKYAAAIVILISLSVFGYFHLNSTQNYKVVSNTTNQPLQFSLDDGSKITLNTNSILKYSEENFNVKDRKLILEGQAFFEVAKNPNKPFIVTTGDLKTKVLGTSFDIDASDQNVLVTVSEGKVAVFNSNDTISLLPNQQAFYRGNVLSTNAVDARHYNYWSQEYISLENISMYRLTEILQELYKVEFIYENDNLKNTIMTISFNKEDNISSVLKTINMINNTKMKIEDDNTVIVRK